MSGGGPRELKRELRASALRARRSIPRDEIEELSSQVGDNLASLPEYIGARLVISYCAKSDEVQTRLIIERAFSEGKRVAVPVTHVPTRTLTFAEISSFEEDLAPGPFGILEPKQGRGRPVHISKADLILVPLVAWDARGRRLGYGAGYFDRALQGAGLPKVGLALESQRVPRIPDSRFDVPLDVIVTEERVLRPRR